MSERNAILKCTESSQDSLSAKSIYDASSYRADKKFGQNFLFDVKINSRIVSIAGDLTDKIVVEVGPGPGGLTLEILKQNVKKLYVVEVDPRWAKIWKDLQPRFADKLEVIEQDALQFDLQNVSPNIVISNLPYNISTELLGRWLTNFDLCQRYVLMFQKEVADRLCAFPCSKDYGRLSVIAQWKSKVTKMYDLEPGSYFPPPKVKSSVLKFEPFTKQDIVCADQYDEFNKLLLRAFLHRRKMLITCLKKEYPSIDEVISSLGYNPKVRAEEISVTDYISILQHYISLSNMADVKS